ncbi:MAG: recombinase RecA, partial [Deltaproteobacteria bacterium]
MKRKSKPVERLSSGSAEFDGILGGGFPTGSVSVIAGDPGTGKTVLTLQMMFHLARQGRRCLYYTTLSEPTLKLIRYVQGFDFFDPALLKERIVIRDLGAAIRADGIASVAARVKKDVERDEPDLVAIDSAKALHDFAPNQGLRRVVFYDLAVTLAAWESTTFLVGEYRSDEVGELPEFAVADCIIELRNRPRELTTIREVEVLKLRGSSYMSGRHFFDIDASGLTFYPRVRAPEQTGTAPPPTGERVSTGVKGLDALLGGGFPRHSTTV